VIKDLAASRHRLCIDTSLCRTVALAELANAIPRSSYLFGVSWPDVRRTLLVAVEQNGDPDAVMIPTLEVIRFYYAPSTRLAQALFWGEYNETFSAGRSGVFEEGVDLADVSVPLLGTSFVETPQISGGRSIVHFILFLLCFYFGFVRKPKA
jgi:hypothetical protein